MRKERVQYPSPLDALIAVAKPLSLYENQKNMDSEDFFFDHKVTESVEN